MLAFAAQVVGCGFPSPDQIADSLVDHVRHPHSGQFARPMQPRQRDRVPPVRLDPLARPLRDQGRRNNHAVVTKIADLTAMEATLAKIVDNCSTHRDSKPCSVLEVLEGELVASPDKMAELFAPVDL